MKDILFNPINLESKSITGAVCSDEIVTLTLKITKKYNIYDINLLVKDDYNNIVLTSPCIKYEHGFVDEENYNLYKVDISDLKAGLYWYHFEFTDYYGKHYIAANSGLDAILVDYVPLLWQLLVYDRFKGDLNWFKGKVMYQIMVDRFFKGGNNKPKEDVYMHKYWDEVPFHYPINGVYAHDFYGGDLLGVCAKLDYLKSLNVGVIYLNPIFEAKSNHKYDTGDYSKIDSMFGTEEDFKLLCEEAKKRDIRIILDGVFNHTGDDSIYFNKYYRYPVVGACQSKDSPYYSWFRFFNYPHGYDSWWGFTTLPAINQKSKEYVEYITGTDGIIQKWLKLGASGFRLDVVDELSNELVEKISTAVKSVDNDKMLIGEVWEDASHKVAYSERKNYFLGHELDSVMNYPFKDAIIDYIKYGDSHNIKLTIRNIINNYPKHVLDSLMNMLDTHDTVRIISMFSNCDFYHMTNEQLANYYMKEEEYKKALKKVKLCSAICYTLPGTPSIFYGDEAGLEGFKDPFCRRTFPWKKENQELLAWYRKLGEIRNESVYVDGVYKEEFIEKSIFAFSRNKDGQKIITIVNNGSLPFTYNIEKGIDLLTDTNITSKTVVSPNSVQIIKVLN